MSAAAIHGREQCVLDCGDRWPEVCPAMRHASGDRDRRTSRESGGIMRDLERMVGVSRASERDREASQLPPARHGVEAADIRAIRDEGVAHAVESVAETTRICADILSNAGSLAVLSFLNARTRFRFTGLYRVEPPLLRNTDLYDRENPTLNVSGEISRLDDTYCGILWRNDRPFCTPNAHVDERLEAHAARERVLSYCGVPIRGESGCVCGTLCHFDDRPRLLHTSEIHVLEAAAPLFALRLGEISRPG